MLIIISLRISFLYNNILSEYIRVFEKQYFVKKFYARTRIHIQNMSKLRARARVFGIIST